MSMSIRRAAPGDETVLRALRLDALGDAPQAFGSTYERELARTTADWQRWLSSGITLILEESAAPSGLVAGMGDAADPHLVHLMAMWVHPRLRGTGAADLLVSAHLAWARSVGASRVAVDVFTTNPRARRLYERHGFRSNGSRVTRADGRVEVRLLLDLDSVQPA